MSLLIKGLKIPQSGRITLQIGSDGAVYIVDKYKLISEKYDESIVVNEIPPHGRLIDADILKSKFRHGKGDDDGDSAWISTIRRFITQADTIIGAEGSKE